MKRTKKNGKCSRESAMQLHLRITCFSALLFISVHHYYRHFIGTIFINRVSHLHNIFIAVHFGIWFGRHHRKNTRIHSLDREKEKTRCIVQIRAEK